METIVFWLWNFTEVVSKYPVDDKTNIGSGISLVPSGNQYLWFHILLLGHNDR